MPEPTQLLLQLVSAPDGSSLSPGTTWPVVDPSVVVGRSPGADVVVADRTVSREHVRIDVGPPARVTALTRSNGTFLDQVPLDAGRTAPLPTVGSRLQVGGVLLAVTLLADTAPVHEPIGTQAPAASMPALRVVWDAGQCVVRCGERDVGLTGAAARMLGLLAGRAGEVVHHWDLQEELHTPHLAPLATAVRHALAAAVEAGALSEDRLREQLLRSGTEAPQAEDVHALMRRVVQSRRGHGYVLHLPPDDIQTEQV